MKGIHGLILAIGLGIAGALFNFAYLKSRSGDIEKVAFVGIKEDKTVGQGEKLNEDMIEPVEIPRRWVGKLEDYAYPWSAWKTVMGSRVARPLDGGSLLLRSDMKTPPQELVFGVNLPQGVEERAVGVPIDTQKFVTSLVQPGDMVSFIVSAGAADSPTLATDAARAAAAGKAGAKPATAAAAGRPEARDPIEKCGPFRVLSIGNRLGRYNVMAAARIPQTQENVMTIAVRYDNGKRDPEATRLLQILKQTNSKPLAYELYPRVQKQE